MTFNSVSQLHASAFRPSGLLRMIDAGLANRLTRFVVEDVEVDGIVQTQTVAIIAVDLGQVGSYPVVMIDRHDCDDRAMQFSLQVFDAMKRAGLASSDQVARWRRGLFAAVS